MRSDAVSASATRYVAESPWVRMRRRMDWLFRRKSFVLGIVLLLLFLISAIFCPWLAPYPPDKTDYSVTLQPPSASHLLGTDEHGRDLFSRVMFGTRISFIIAGLSVGLATVVGVPLGLTAGYFGGLYDMVVGRILDTIFAFPAVLLAMGICVLLGPSETTAMIAIGIVSIPEFARISRSAVIAVKEETYIEASRAAGASAFHILVRGILPNCLDPLVVLISLGFGYAVLNEAALSFLGIGAQPPSPSWGLLLARGRRYLFEAPWYSVFPGLAILLLVCSTNLIGDGVRDLADPRTRKD